MEETLQTSAERGDRGPSQGRRESLLDVAIEVVSEQGLSAASFRTLAAAAGTSTTAFTYEFGSRAGLLEAMVERAFEVAWTRRGFDRYDDEGDALAKLRRAANLAIQYEPGIDPWQRTYDRFVFESPFQPEVRDRIKHFDTILMERLLGLIDLAREQGSIDPGMPTRDALFMLWSFGDGLNIHRYAYPEELGPERTRTLFNEGFDRIMGVRKDPERPRYREVG
jgi:AcrR family transcriptional regulator